MILVATLLLILRQATYAMAANYDILSSISDVRKLKVGQELLEEQLALPRGQCIYALESLELTKAYEVKISYPASIPANFTLELLKEGSFPATRGGRRLLNTEKLIFRADESPEAEVNEGMTLAHVLVTVQSAGVVAKPFTKDHSFVTYNILCEEVRLGIPMQAWWIGVLGAAAIMISALAPKLFPPHLLPARRGKEALKKLAA